MKLKRGDNFKLYLLALYVLGVTEPATAAVNRRCKQTIIRKGIPFPSRKCLVDLDRFKEKVDNTTLKPFYFSSTLPDEEIFAGGDFTYMFSDDGTFVVRSFSGRLPDGMCISGNTTWDVISDKAEFLRDSYIAYFSSDIDSYLISFQCMVNRRKRRCPLDSIFINILVGNSRPDSLPLHKALRDLWRVVCLTLDFTFGDFRSVFAFGENTCP